MTIASTISFVLIHLSKKANIDKMDAEKIAQVKGWRWMISPIMAWGICIITASTLECYPDTLTKWPGFLMNLIIYYIAEFCYFQVLLYWTSLDYTFALWISKNFDKEQEQRQSNLSIVTRSKTESIKSYQKLH